MPGYFPLESLRGLYPEFTLGAVTPGFKRGGPIGGPATAGGVGGGAGGITPLTPNNTGAFGTKPVVPDPLTAARDAIAAAMANLPTAISGANQVNAANQAAALKQITDIYPQFVPNTNQIGENLGAWSRGEWTPAATADLRQQIAEWGTGRGIGGASPAAIARFVEKYALGQNALQKQAIEGQNALLSGLPHTALTDPLRLNIEPNSLANNLWNARWTAEQVNAAADEQQRYILAMQNALAGQRRGYNAGFTPPANVGGADPNIQRLLDSLISRTQANNTPQAWDGSGGSQAMVDAMKNQNTPTNTPNTPWTTGAWNIPGYGFGTSDEYDMNYLMYGLDQLGIYDQGQNTNYDPFNNEG